MAITVAYELDLGVIRRAVLHEFVKAGIQGAYTIQDLDKLEDLVVEEVVFVLETNDRQVDPLSVILLRDSHLALVLALPVGRVTLAAHKQVIVATVFHELLPVPKRQPYGLLHSVLAQLPIQKHGVEITRCFFLQTQQVAALTALVKVVNKGSRDRRHQPVYVIDLPIHFYS